MSEFFFQQTPAPGREGPSAPAQPAAPAPAQPGQPAEGAPPAEGARPPAGGFDPTMILLFVAPLLLFFFMSRNQNKKQKQLESSLKTGDRVVTRSGLIGKVISLDERTSKIEIAPGVNVVMLKTAIEGIDGGDKPAADAKAKDDKSKETSKDEKSKDEKKDGGKDKPQDKKA